MTTVVEQDKRNTLIEDIKDMKSGSYEEMWLVTMYGLSSYFKSLFAFGHKSNVTRDNLNVIKEMFNVLKTERKLFNYILRNLDSFHLESTEDVVFMLDELNEKTLEYYYNVLDDIEDAAEMKDEMRGIRPRKSFPTLTQSSSYTSEVMALALDRNAIKEFLGYEEEFWKFVKERENSEFKIGYEAASHMAYVTALRDSNNLISDVKFFVPSVIDLNTALLAIQTYQKVYKVYKCIGRSDLNIEIGDSKLEEFETRYLPALSKKVIN